MNTYIFRILFLEDDNVIESDKFKVKSDNKDFAEDSAYEYAEEQLIHYDNADDYEVKLIDVC